jgi:hypothetical protein
MANSSEEYFQALGEQFGLEATPGDDGACCIVAEGAPGVIVRANDAATRMELSAVVAAELPEGAAYSDILDLLGLALGPLFDAPGIGRDPESGAIILYALLPFTTTTPADFAEAVPQFLDRARNVSDRLASLEPRE